MLVCIKKKMSIKSLNKMNNIVDLKEYEAFKLFDRHNIKMPYNSNLIFKSLMNNLKD